MHASSVAPESLTSCVPARRRPCRPAVDRPGPGACGDREDGVIERFLVQAKGAEHRSERKRARSGPSPGSDRPIRGKGAGPRPWFSGRAARRWRRRSPMASMQPGALRGPGWKAAAASVNSVKPFLAGQPVAELLGELESAGLVLLSSTTCTGRTSRPRAPSFFALRRLVPTRCWCCSRCATTPSRSFGEPAQDRLGSPRCRRARAGPRRARAAGAARSSGGRVAPLRGARLLRDGTHGNPLHVRRGTRREPSRAVERPGKPLPSPRSFRRLVGDRYAACGAETRDLLDAAAVLGVRAALPLAAAVGGVTEPVQAVDEAVRRGLLVADTARHPWTLAFPHPLVRSAPCTTHSARPGARRCTSPPPGSSTTRSRCCTTGSPPPPRSTPRSPTISRGSPTVRRSGRSGRAQRDTWWRPAGCVRTARRAAGGCSSR